MGQLKKRGQIWWMRSTATAGGTRKAPGSTKEGEAKRLLRLREGDTVTAGVFLSVPVRADRRLTLPGPTKLHSRTFRVIPVI